MTDTFQAQTYYRGDRWRLFVAVLNVPVSQWPEHNFASGAAVPTLAERERVLAGLGYAPGGGEWEWQEYSAMPDDPESAVRLIAATYVEVAR